MLESYYYIGVMIATSTNHGGPAADVVADYIVYGMSGVKATAADNPLLCCPDDGVEGNFYNVFSYVILS